jgi:hypothetical protein
MTTTDSLTAHFPVPTLSPLAIGTDEPTWKTIREARTQLNSNAASIPSNAGGGRHGHLKLTMTAAEYSRIVPTPFVAPLHPGVLAHPANATGPQILEATRLHKLALDDFRVYHTVDQALRNQLIEATPPTYLQTVKDPLLGFGQVSTLDILTHLRATYGTITPEELDKNNERMAAAWHPPTPIEDLFEQLRVGTEFATEGGDVPSAQAQVRLGYKLVFQTGLFNEGCRAWRILPPANHTFAVFQTHFKQWDRDRRLLETAASAGYHGAANQVEERPQAPLPMPTQADLAAIRTQIALLTTAMAAATTAANVVVPTTFPATASLAGSVITQTTLHPNAIDNSYCWTHGSSRNRSHTSITCEHPAEGHQTAATLDNQMGGSTRVWGEADRRTPR